MTSPKRFYALAAVTSIVCALAACSGADSTSKGEATMPQSTAAAASDAGGETTGPAIVVESSESPSSAENSETGGGLPTITSGGLDLSALPSTCSNEGMILLPVNGEPEPALEGFTGKLTYKGWDEAEGGKSKGNFTLDQGDGEQAFGPLQLGDQFTLGTATYSVTSICADNAELDKIS